MKTKTNFIFLNKKKSLIPLIGIIILLFSSCVDQEVLRSERAILKSQNELNGNDSEASGGSNPSLDDPSAPFDGNIDTGSNIADGFAFGRADLRHFVDPFDGTYKTKITVPKNLAGLLYISGINVSGLSERLIRVRFNFGREYEPIDVPATVGRAPGITPQTDIEVLILDMSSQPFNRIRLMYDLFDYTNYDGDSNGTEVISDSLVPSNAKSTNLYCRGLFLEHDPTFEDVSGGTGKCDASSDTCLYAYAKISDSHLYNSSGYTTTPTVPQIDHSGSVYTSDSTYDGLRCLPDTDGIDDLKLVLNSSNIGDNTTLGIGDTVTFTDGSTMTFNGPFRTYNFTNWEITGDAIFSSIDNAGDIPKGLFQKYITTQEAANGFRSFLYPRFGKMELSKDTEYVGLSSTALSTATRSPIKKMISSGETDYMDGCNLRISNYDPYTNEGLSSCNVTATIEVISLDPETGAQTKILKTPNKSLKLQIIRPSLVDYAGREVLFEALKTCQNSKDCKSDECCFNQRCWSKRIVTQCKENVTDQGNLPVGATCGSDFQCSSLCCSGSTKVCAPHVNNFTDKYKVLCSKSPGQTCVAQEWCQKVDLRKCLVVKTGISVTGKQECGLRCYNVPTFAECRDGVCVPPQPYAIPAFDPLDPNRCNQALDPPKNLNQLK